jgi:recombinational DNA repair protein (RecF pathway)
VKEWNEEDRPRLGQTVPMLYAASFLCELTLALSQHTAGSKREDSEPETACLYDLLAATADACAAGSRPGPLILAFALRALENEGFLPDLRLCASCSKNLLKTSGAVWLSADGLRCSNCMRPVTREQNGRRDESWRTATAAFPLSPDALRALLHIQVTGRPVTLSAKGAEQLSRALVVLIHGALERDLRTLPAAVRMVRAMGMQKDVKGAKGRV